jgi:type VI secretion system secreted protein VgrG
MAQYIHADRLMNFTTPLGDDQLLIERLNGFEGVSEMFCYQLELFSEVLTADFNKPIDPSKIVGQKVCVSIQATDDGTLRYINGIVSSFEGVTSDTEFVTYRATVVPSLWFATLNKNTRVFQNETAIDVIKDVLSTYSISPTDNTNNTYESLEYCTQYRETDFNFVSRLMEQHGISYYFDHTADNHQMVLVDTASTFSACPIQDEYLLDNQNPKLNSFYQYVISDLMQRSTMVPGKFTLWDHSFVTNNQVKSDQTASSSAWPIAPAANEIYDYPTSVFGYIKTPSTLEASNPSDVQKFFVQVDQMAASASACVVEGFSNAIPMQTGYYFTVDTQMTPYFAADDFDQKFVLLHIEHSVDQNPSYRSRGSNEAPRPYSNRFRAIRSDIPFTPPKVTEKPVVHGMHSGFVVVDSGEDSHMDKYGRVNVQFWWDRLRQPDTPDNTWLRVAQSWAGKGWGTYYWPRVGDEILIAFMEGDPDQPIVVGSVYNGVNMPKYDPVGQYTLSGILTRSSKNGGASNANELRFEDLKGSEQIYMNAEKDYVLHVENDWMTQVGAEQHTKITKNRFDEVDGDEHTLVKGVQNAEVDGDASLNLKGNHLVQVGGDRSHNIQGNLLESIGQNSNISVGMNLNESIGQNQSLTVGMNTAISAGMNFDVSAPMQISFSNGPNSIFMSAEQGIGLNGTGGYISIGPEGVVISGMMVMINSGGPPVMGSPGTPQSPQSPNSPTAPTAPQWPGDAPPSQAASGGGGSAAQSADMTTASNAGQGGSSPSQGGGDASPGAGAAGAAGGMAGAAAGAMGQAQQDAQQAVNQIQQAANQAASQASAAANQAAAAAQQAVQQAQTAAQQAEQQAQQAYNQVVDQARQTYNQAQQAVNQAQQAVAGAVGQAKQAAQGALNQAEQQAQAAAQQAAGAVQAAQQQLNQVQQQAQGAVNQAKQAAQQAQQQAQQAVSQAKNAANQAVQQAKQQVQNAAQQGQQAVQQAEQQAQGAVNNAKTAATQAASQATQAAKGAEQQAQQAAQQAQQTAQGAASQVKNAAAGAQQAAQQAAQGAQQSAQQAMNSAKQGF